VSVLGDPFFQRALVEAVLTGALCGVVGVHVLLRRLPFLAIALGHATFPGVVLASLIGLDLVLGSGLFGLVLVLVVAALGSRERIDETSAIGVVLAGAFSIGVLLVATRPGFSRDLTAFLVGSVTTVQGTDIAATAIIGVVVLASCAALHKLLVMGAFDRSGLAALGYPAARVDLAFLVVLELTLVASVPAVGTILAVALITAPAAAARLWTDRVAPAMAVSAAIGAASGALGLVVSTIWRIAAGPAIVLVATAAFVVSLLAGSRGGRLRGSRRVTRRAAAPAR
jgi:manganese/iron transport system permease protein